MIILICKNGFKTGSIVDILIDFRLPDVGEEAKIHFGGEEITINVSMLTDIQKLGFGNYGSVMLAEVQNHPHIKMAVKVRFLMHL